jgi:hypothetical protein
LLNLSVRPEQLRSKANLYLFRKTLMRQPCWLDMLTA